MPLTALCQTRDFQSAVFAHLHQEPWVSWGRLPMPQWFSHMETLVSDLTVRLLGDPILIDVSLSGCVFIGTVHTEDACKAMLHPIGAKTPRVPLSLALPRAKDCQANSCLLRPENSERKRQYIQYSVASRSCPLFPTWQKVLR